MTARTRLTAAALALALLAAADAPAQIVLERTPNLSGGWIGLPGLVEFDILQRYYDPPREGLGSLPTALLALGLRPPALVGLNFAVQSPVAPGQPDEAELFGRYRFLEQAKDAPLDATVQLGFNTAAESLDGELALGRWFGPLRVLGALRAFSNGYSDDAQLALAGGAVVFPLPRRVPVALAADIGSLLDRDGREEWVWGAGVQIGLSFISSTLSIQATNATSGTLEGASLGLDDTRIGFELTVPIPTAAQLLGYYVPREAAREVVRPLDAAPPRAARVVIRDYLFRPDRIEIPVGGTVEWVNEDEVVHTATADDAAWNSGAIPPGGRWSATFSAPGVYPYHCGPHPFMRGVVIVR